MKHASGGIHQGDVAILVLSAVPHESETAFAVDSQTRDHATMAYCFGVRHVIVAINKLDRLSESKDGADTVYPQERFEAVREQAQKMLQKCGFKPKQITCIPTSAVVGDNLVERSAHTPWYEGPTLLETLDGLPLPERQVAQPLRIPINEVHTVAPAGVSAIICGRIESGKVAVRDRIIIAPLGEEAVVESIQMHSRDLDEAGPGDEVGLGISRVSRKMMKLVRTGSVVGLATAPPTMARQFQARVMVAKKKNPFRVNQCAAVYIHSAVFQAKIVALNQRLDSRTGAVVSENPTELGSGETGIVTFEVPQPVPIETFSTVPKLGRFCIQENRRVIALGVVTSIIM